MGSIKLYMHTDAKNEGHCEEQCEGQNEGQHEGQNERQHEGKNERQPEGQFELEKRGYNDEDNYVLERLLDSPTCQSKYISPRQIVSYHCHMLWNGEQPSVI